MIKTSAVLSGVIFLAGCGQAPAVQTQPTPALVVQKQTQSTTTQSSSSVAGSIYTNTDFGFRIKLPAGWENYKPLIAKNDMKKEASFVHILIPTSEKQFAVYDPNTKKIINGYADMFSVGIWDVSLWSKKLGSKNCANPHPGCPLEDEVVAKNSRYVFVASFSQDYPRDDSAIMQLIPGLADGTTGLAKDFLKDKFELIAK